MGELGISSEEKEKVVDEPVIGERRQLWLWTDGGSRHNPGPAAIGMVLKDRAGETLWEEGRYIGSPISNNQAEYQAIKEGLVAAKRLGAEVVYCRLDSQLVVEQLNGRYKVKDAGMQKWWQEVQNLLPEFEQVVFTHVRRTENRRADELVNRALDESGFG